MLTATLGDGGLGDQLEADLRTLRGASTEFLRRVEGLVAGDSPDGWEDRQLQEWLFEGDARSWVFNQALGAYRAAAGMVVAKLAVEFGIDIENHWLLCSLMHPSDQRIAVVLLARSFGATRPQRAAIICNCGVTATLAAVLVQGLADTAPLRCL